MSRIHSLNRSFSSEPILSFTLFSFSGRHGAWLHYGKVVAVRVGESCCDSVWVFDRLALELHTACLQLRERLATILDLEVPHGSNTWLPMTSWLSFSFRPCF